MKIVYLSPSGQLGGAELSLLDIFASMRAAVPEWSFNLVVAGAGPLSARAESLGVKTTVLPFPPALAGLGDSGMDVESARRLGYLNLFRRFILANIAVLVYIRRLRRVISELAPDVLHSNGFKMHVLGVWARPRNTPIIWHVRDYVRSRPVMAHILRWHASRCSAVIANSKSVAGDLRNAFGEQLPLHQVYNAIDLEQFSSVGPTLDLDALAGLPQATSGTVKVGLLGTMARWKGQEVFLRALSLLPPQLPIRAYIVGGALYQTEGSQYKLEELQAIAHQLGLAGRVGFTGFVENSAAAMRALDVIVHASTKPEPFGRVIVEGMACGRAVIFSRAGGAREIVEGEAGALGHRPGDAETLAAHIQQLVADSTLRAQLAAQGCSTVQRRFDRRQLAGQLLPIYRSVTA